MLTNFYPSSMCTERQREQLKEPSRACVHLFYSHKSTEFSCAVHLHEGGSNVYTVLEGATSNQIPDSDLLSMQTQTRRREHGEGEETLASLSDLTNPTGRSFNKTVLLKCCVTIVCHDPHKTHQINPESHY